MRSAKHLVIGAGVHGLSTAWHLAEAGEDVLLVDKTGVAAGASGIACGVVRNNYFQPAMQDLMAACVEIWESDPQTFAYHGSGYIALGDGDQEADLTAVHERQQRIGYDSELILGEADVAAHMRSLFPDWRAPGSERVPARTLGRLCLQQGLDARPGRQGPGGRRADRGGRRGDWLRARRLGGGHPRAHERRADRRGAGGGGRRSVGGRTSGRCSGCRAASRWPASEREMWTYWYLQEGEIDVDPSMFVTADGSLPPVMHVDSHAPLHDDSGRLITDEQWGIYFKQDKHSVQGGAEPLPQGHEFEVDPYPTGTVEPGFPDMWCAALSHCMERFEGKRPRYRATRSGGVGAFTADNFPVFDYMRPNVFVAADSNHGYKMIAVGREVARVVTGEHSSLLHPFRYERFATGDLHPVSHSPYPWS